MVADKFKVSTGFSGVIAIAAGGYQSLALIKSSMITKGDTNGDGTIDISDVILF